MGIILHDSSKNNIFKNTVARSYWGGINIYENCNENLLFQNNLIENEIQNGYDICGNSWDNREEGNFWDDYTGEDNNGDGIGDTPYIIVGNTTKDNYPLMDINEIPSTPTIDGPVNCKPGEEYEYTFVVTDPNNDDIFIYVDWGDNTNSNWIGPYESGMEIILQHSWSKKGTFLITARAKDANGYYGSTKTKEIKSPKIDVSFNLLFYRHTEKFLFLERILFQVL
jgi:parallel beta-helix repeat protein